MNAEWTAVKIDEENGDETWWAALDATYPGFADSLRNNRVAVIRSELWSDLAALPGFDDGPEHAPDPILDCGWDNEQAADVLAARHSVFETLA